MDIGRREATKSGGISFDASPRSTIHVFTNSTTQSRTKTVSFAPEDMLVKEIPPLRMELTEDDITTLWYTKAEYRLSKKSQLFIVKMMEKGLRLEEDDELCPRGLEAKTRKGARGHQDNIDASREAVMWEQDKQWRDGRHSAVALARVYAESAAQSKMAAFVTGKRDALYVHGKEALETNG